MNEEKKAIQEIIKIRQESVKFFSNDFKKEREKWVVNEFLNNLEINFECDELMSINDQAPDIIFQGVPFEVKEIDEKGRRRHAEMKEELKQAEVALSLKDCIKLGEFNKNIHILLRFL